MTDSTNIDSSSSVMGGGLGTVEPHQNTDGGQVTQNIEPLLSNLTKVEVPHHPMHLGETPILIPSTRGEVKQTRQCYRVPLATVRSHFHRSSNKGLHQQQDRPTRFMSEQQHAMPLLNVSNVDPTQLQNLYAPPPKGSFMNYGTMLTRRGSNVLPHCTLRSPYTSLEQQKNPSHNADLHVGHRQVIGNDRMRNDFFQSQTSALKKVTLPAKHGRPAENKAVTPVVNVSKSLSKDAKGQMFPDQDNRQPRPGTGLFFSSRAEAQNAMALPQWQPPKNDVTIPNTDAARQYWVSRLVEAMTNLHDVHDKPGAVFKRRWYNSENGVMDYYDPKDIEIVCWNIVDKIEDLHRFGPGVLRCNYDPSFKLTIAKTRDQTFQDRIEAVIQLLKDCKGRCDKVMKGGFIDSYIAAPNVAYMCSVSNRKQNSKRQLYIKAGRDKEWKEKPDAESEHQAEDDADFGHEGDFNSFGIKQDHLDPRENTSHVEVNSPHLNGSSAQNHKVQCGVINTPSERSDKTNGIFSPDEDKA